MAVLLLSLFPIESVGRGGPTATHFSCFAKKSKQRRRRRSALRVSPIAVTEKWGDAELASGSNICAAFSHFSATQLASTCGKDENIQADGRTNFKQQLMFGFGFGFGFGFNPLLTLPIV